MYCKVEGCRFSAHHVTCAHVCGTCGVKGHGVRECGNVGLIAALDSASHELIPPQKQCCVGNCKDIGRHTTAGHPCTHSACGKFGHDVTECPDALWDIQRERGLCAGKSERDFKEKRHTRIQARNKMGWEEHKIYTDVYAGVGCWWFARRTNNWDKIELMSMHSNDWGMYDTGDTGGTGTGIDTTLSVFQNFIRGFRPVSCHRHPGITPVPPFIN